MSGVARTDVERVPAVVHGDGEEHVVRPHARQREGLLGPRRAVGTVEGGDVGDEELLVRVVAERVEGRADGAFVEDASGVGDVGRQVQRLVRAGRRREEHEGQDREQGREGGTDLERRSGEAGHGRSRVPDSRVRTRKVHPAILRYLREDRNGAADGTTPSTAPAVLRTVQPNRRERCTRPASLAGRAVGRPACWVRRARP